PWRALARQREPVRGAARGVASAVPRPLAAPGAKIPMLGCSAAPPPELAGHPKLQSIQADVCEPEGLARAFDAARDRFGPIHILVNNAGQGVSASFLKTDSALWRNMMAVNLDGTFHCIHAVL